MNIKNVVVVGAGMMGNALAQVFASNPDLHVTLKTRSLKDGRWQPIENNLDIMIARGAATEQEKKDIMSRIHFETDDAKAYSDADFVIECFPEVMETKQQLLCTIENYCSDKCILATNSSVMSSTEIGSKCKHPERVVGAHFWNPGHLIPLVEVIKSDKTEEWVIDETMELMTSCGKKPVYCKKDVPGFIANRMQHALWREAISIVEHGIADAATVDEAVRYSFGLRLPQLGPMQNADLVGTDLTYNIHDYILKDLEDTHEPSPLLKQLRDEGKIGFKTGEGFQKWTPEQVVKSNADLNEYLIRMLYGK